MKYSLLFILTFIVSGVYSQSDLDDAILFKVIQSVESGQAMNVNNLDSLQQQKIIVYLQAFNTDSILYTNINNLFEFIFESFFSSNYKIIRQDAANLLLDIYRIKTVSYDNGFWHKKAKQTDFNTIARKKIMNILNAAPFTKTEKELLYKNELYTSLEFYENDTLFIRDYTKKSNLNLKELRDSIATVETFNNINNKSPEQYVLPGIILLAAWLDMKEAVPIIEEQLVHENYESIRDMYKLALARLENKKYETEILNKTNIAYYLPTIGFLATDAALDKVINELKEDNSKFKVEMSAGNPAITIPYICEFLIFQNYENLIMNFPFEYNYLSLDCDIGNEERNKIIDWLEQNQDRIELNRDFH